MTLINIERGTGLDPALTPPIKDLEAVKSAVSRQASDDVTQLVHNPLYLAPARLGDPNSTAPEM